MWAEMQLGRSDLDRPPTAEYRSAVRRSYVFGLVLGVGAAAACSGTPTSPLDPGLPPNVPFDAGETADAGMDAGGETGPALDTVAPAKIDDLRATATGLDSIRLDWTAPGDDALAGVARSYEVRRSAAPIVTEADFAAATAITPAPAPLAARSPQTMNVTGLTPDTTYYFAIRALDDVPNRGPISNCPSAKTFARAKLLINEVAVSNSATEGFDFVELVAVTAGRVDGLVVRQASGVLYTLAPLAVQAGDLIVVHATGLPGPTGFAQEDTTGNKSASTASSASAGAIDVYSSTVGLVATDNVISVVDGTTTMDALALSSRDGDAAAATMNAFAALKLTNQWTFTATPADGVNDCATQREAVSVATTDTACGGFDVKAGPGRSVNRFGTTDTNSKRDFYVAAQTPGQPNDAPAAPTVVSAIATSATSALIRFDQEILPASVTLGAFTVTGLAASAAALSDVHVVTLTTDPQSPGTAYPVGVASSIQSLQGVALGSPSSGVLCGYSAATTLLISEIAPDITGGADLVELRVTQGGSLAGVELRVDRTAANAGTLLATLPAICAATGDVVVVHLSPASTPAGSLPMSGGSYVSETTATNQYANATYGGFYDGAWDVIGANVGISHTDHVLLVRSPGGTVIDAAAFTDGNGTTTQTFRDALAYVQGLGHWLPATCGGAACTDATTPTAEGISANWLAVGTTTTGSTIRRDAATTDTHRASDWSVGAQSLGAPNP
jgi:hypothetical protein